MRLTGGEGEEGGVDFGKVCVGETVRRCVTLHNDGALPTDFTVTGSSTEIEKVSKAEIELGFKTGSDGCVPGGGAWWGRD